MRDYNYDKEFLDERIFRFIYGCALRDAILEKSFSGDRIWINDVTEAIAPVRFYIDHVLKDDFQTDTDHDEAFLTATKNVCDIINNYGSRPAGVGIFHFGNAQKLINMTVKHVYTHAYSIHTAGYSTIRECFRYCHCPLDQEMRTKVWEDYGNIIGKKERKQALPKFDEFHKAWGSEDFDSDSEAKSEAKDDRILPSRYMTFQNAIRAIITKKDGNIFPIEYDFIEWKA